MLASLFLGLFGLVTMCIGMIKAISIFGFVAIVTMVAVVATNLIFVE